MKTMLLTTAYFAPVQYYSKLFRYSDILIEKYENYNKQSYRNRCKIYGANGVQTLSIPIKKEHTKKVLTKDIHISYETNWQKQHFKSIESAYGCSPFFEYFIDEIAVFFNKKYIFLLDFNNEIQKTILDFLEIETQISFTKDFINLELNNKIIDFREKIQAKKQIVDNDFTIKKYKQVFDDKFEFKPNLSILDLIFNEGSNTLSFL